MNKKNIIKQRLDNYLVQNKYCQTRNKAQELIKNKQIKINREIISNKSFLIDENSIVEIIGDSKISRGYYKLNKAQEEFKINFKNKICLDIGSSTGGFCQLILENNPKKIYALDVGSNQLDKTIKENKKVISIEKQNFLNIEKELILEKINLITCDVSFISIEKILNKIEDLKWKKFEIIFLFKPEFEIGKQLASKYKGYVNIKYHKKLIDNIMLFLQKNYSDVKITQSPIKGAKKENIEYLIYAKHK